jgi:hypothetical protein
MKHLMMLGAVFALVAPGCFDKSSSGPAALDGGTPTGDFRAPVANAIAPAPKLKPAEVATVAGFHADAEKLVTSGNLEAQLQLLEKEINPHSP